MAMKIAKDSRTASVPPRGLWSLEAWWSFQQSTFQLAGLAGRHAGHFGGNRSSNRQRCKSLEIFCIFHHIQIPHFLLTWSPTHTK